MSIHTNEAGTIKNTAADGNRIAVRLWPAVTPPYNHSSYGNPGYAYNVWVDDDRPYLSITNPSVDYVWPFSPAFILYLSVDDNSADDWFILYPGAEAITRTVGNTSGRWLCKGSPSGSGYSGYWVYGDSSISLSGNTMTVTYFNVDRAKDKHSEDDPRYVQGLFIAIA